MKDPLVLHASVNRLWQTRSAAAANLLPQLLLRYLQDSEQSSTDLPWREVNNNQRKLVRGLGAGAVCRLRSTAAAHWLRAGVARALGVQPRDAVGLGKVGIGDGNRNTRVGDGERPTCAFSKKNRGSAQHLLARTQSNRSGQTGLLPELGPQPASLFLQRNSAHSCAAPACGFARQVLDETSPRTSRLPRRCWSPLHARQRDAPSHPHTNASTNA